MSNVMETGRIAEIERRRRPKRRRAEFHFLGTLRVLSLGAISRLKVKCEMRGNEVERGVQESGARAVGREGKRTNASGKPKEGRPRWRAGFISSRLKVLQLTRTPLSAKFDSCRLFHHDGQLREDQEGTLASKSRFRFGSRIDCFLVASLNITT